jgi:hypothetical protein
LVIAELIFKKPSSRCPLTPEFATAFAPTKLSCTSLGSVASSSHFSSWAAQLHSHQLATAPIPLQRGDAKIEPPNYGGGVMVPPEDIEPLSKIIAELNEQFGTKFTDEDCVVIKRLEDQLLRDKILEQQIQVGGKLAMRLSFEQVAQDMLHALIDSNFKFYKKVQDDQDIARELFHRLFERYYAKKAKRP